MRTLILILILSVTGCAVGPLKTVLIDDSLISEETATAIFYAESRGSYDIFVDGIFKGTLTRHIPMRIEVDAGKHKVWGRNSGMLDRRTDVELFAGETYVFHVYWHRTGFPGMLASRVMLKPGVESYQAYECSGSEARRSGCP